MITFTSYASSSAGNIHIVTDGDTRVMLDCGIPWKKIREKLQFNTSDIQGVLVTHSHSDHCKGAAEAAKAGLDIYAAGDTFQALQILEHRKNVVEAGKIFIVGSWHVLPFETVHDSEGALGFYMVNFAGEALLYLTDSAYSPVKFSNLHTIAIECNFTEQILSKNIIEGNIPAVVGHRVRRSHMSLERLITMLRSNDLSKCRQIHLLHLSDGNSDERQMIRAVQEATGIPVYAAS